MKTEELVLDLLLSIAKNGMTHPDGYQVHISRLEIAKIIGRSRENVGKALSSLERKCLISKNKKGGMDIVVFMDRLVNRKTCHK